MREERQKRVLSHAAFAVKQVVYVKKSNAVYYFKGVRPKIQNIKELTK